MKTVFSILVLLISPTLSIAQEKIDFVIKYIPETNYQFSISQISTYTVSDKSSDAESISPQVSKDSLTLRYLAITKKKEKNGIPLTIELIDSISGNLDVGTRFYGKTMEEKIEIDSISTHDNHTSSNKILLDAVQSMLNQVEFPSQEAKIGVDFTHDTILSFSNGPFPIDINVQSKYLLTKIEDGYGYFDIHRNYYLETESNGLELNVVGLGNGNLTYDIENNFYSESEFSFELEMALKMEEIEIETLVESISKTTTKINKASR